MAINLDDKCIKCGTSLRRQMFFAMMIDAGAKTLDPCKCPNGGDHDFQPEIEVCVLANKSKP